MKTNQDNNVTNRTCTVYTENDTELSWPIRSGTVYDENQIRQLHKDAVYVKRKLSYRNRLDHIRSVLKTRQDNDATNRIGLVYIEIET